MVSSLLIGGATPRLPLAANMMTERVQLRVVQDADLPLFFEHQLDPTANHMVAFTRREPTDRDAFDAHWTKIRADDTATIRTILFADQTAGYIATFEHEGKREVGYWIGKEFWGKGIASAALSQFLKQFSTRPLFGFVAKDNLGSIRVLEKCGFVLVAEKRAFAKARGVEIDDLAMRLE